MKELLTKEEFCEKCGNEKHRVDCYKCPEQFMEYFRKNYSGPDTIISRPDWHAPKIYHAAIAASAFADLLEACKLAFKLPRPWIDGGIPWNEWDSVCEKIEAAIKKAESGR